MGQLSPDPRLVAVMVAWFFALFIEGAAGFGTTVALAAPFLVSLGIQPVEAVSMALIGHSVGVSFGAIGTPIVPQSAATGLSEQALAQANGLYHSLLGWVMLLAVMRLIRKSLQKQGSIKQPIWGWTVLAAALFLLPYFLLSRWVGPELPTLGGSLIGGLGFVTALGVARWCSTRREATTRTKSPSRQVSDVLRAAAPC